MLNKVIVMGRLTHTPELRYTQNQTPVASFTVAVDRDYQTGGSERQTDFVECAAWRHTAEFVNKYFTKGQMIVVSGSLQSRKWQDKAGNNRVSWEVVADSVHFCGDKKSETMNVSAEDFEDLGDDEGEIPF